MNHDELMSKLKDIHWPDAPSMWPLAQGYYWAFLIIAAFIGLIIYCIAGRTRRQLRRTIKAEMLQIEHTFRTDKNAAELQARVAALVRRLVFQKIPPLKKDVTLVELLPQIMKVMPAANDTEQLVFLLEQDRFKREITVDAELLLHLAKKQIKKCRI